jgi:hypothetical protein|tara:strand:- start:1053 stop:1280 length:228 start_codon:yes stop_codon:yes gene_type:complete
MKFIEEKDSFVIEFTDEEIKVITKTKALFFPASIGKDFAQSLMQVSMKLLKKVMPEESLNGGLKNVRTDQDTSRG